MTSSPIVGSHERVAELAVVIDAYAPERLSRRVSSGFRQFTSVFCLAGAGHQRVGEDVTYQTAERRQVRRAGAVLDTYDDCATHGIGVYGGGQYELGPGRGQAQYLAALFCPDARNDLAPAGFDDPVPPADVPCSPMIVSPTPVGFAAKHEPRTRACVELGSANFCDPAQGAAACVDDRPARCDSLLR